jgi:hypothetical protein
MLLLRIARSGAATLLFALAACNAQQAPLPTVAEVEQRFVNAIGGEAAIMRPRSAITRSRSGATPIFTTGRTSQNISRA